ncbi:MAG: sodium-dependent transporter [Candidatus Marinimicrobia bacterium]|nr:sodium-dependent transporter [Candidatus Neomarinimicrobiota bacterium]
MQENREHWGNKLGFILAAAGSAVGLGNIWKFPYITGQNGGAAFIIIYLICILVVGLPVLIAEILLGRHSQRSPVSTFRLYAQKHKTLWIAVGWMFFATGLIILAYYNVVAGWSLGYILESLTGKIASLTSASDAAEHFRGLITTPAWILFWQFVFVSAGGLIVYFGVKNGIERIARLLMPLFFIILLFLVVWGISLEGSDKGLRFLLKPDWSTVNFKTVLIALGHAFFTLSVGMGVLLTYGSYLNKHDNIFFSGVMITLLDTVIALLAGLAIFTSVFAMGFDPAEGPGLVFHVLPAVFSSMPQGGLFSLLFFSLLSIAALTSTISILEMLVSTLMDETKFSRHHIVIGISLVIFLLGVPAALSFGEWSHITVLKLNMFDIMDYVSANILLPLGGLLVALFVGWYMTKKGVLNELFQGYGTDLSKQRAGSIWYFLVKFVAPVLIFLVFLSAIGVLR